MLSEIHEKWERVKVDEERDVRVVRLVDSREREMWLVVGLW